jgi:hypothetical protein
VDLKEYTNILRENTQLFKAKTDGAWNIHYDGFEVLKRVIVESEFFWVIILYFSKTYRG